MRVQVTKLMCSRSPVLICFITHVLHLCPHPSCTPQVSSPKSCLTHASCLFMPLVFLSLSFPHCPEPRHRTHVLSLCFHGSPYSGPSSVLSPYSSISQSHPFLPFLYNPQHSIMSSHSLSTHSYDIQYHLSPHTHAPPTTLLIQPPLARLH